MKKVGIVGSGPAGLMCAYQLSSAGHEVHVFERRAGLGRKLLVAGSSGLNISHDLPLAEFAREYRGGEKARAFFSKNLGFFPKEKWITFLEKTLGLETFLGTSDRYFVKEMKASNLLKSWTEKCESLGVHFHPKHELSDFSGTTLTFSTPDGSKTQTFEAAAFFLGGASWEETEPSWIELFRKKKIPLTPFQSANVGYEINWPKKFLEEADRKPVKNMRLTTRLGEKEGEVLVTSYGLEGTPVYFLGCPGEAYVDLKPGLTVQEVAKRIAPAKENLAPIRRAKKNLSLSEAGFALLYHFSTEADRASIEVLADRAKKIPLKFLRPRPLSEAISSSGGVSFDAVHDSLELREHPNVYVGGEMLDWDAPTGGFLIQACVLQGSWVAAKIQEKCK